VELKNIVMLLMWAHWILMFIVTSGVVYRFIFFSEADIPLFVDGMGYSVGFFIAVLSVPFYWLLLRQFVL